MPPPSAAMLAYITLMRQRAARDPRGVVTPFSMAVASGDCAEWVITDSPEAQQVHEAEARHKSKLERLVQLEFAARERFPKDLDLLVVYRPTDPHSVLPIT